MAKRPPMNSISNVLMQVMKNLSLEKALDQSRIFKHWESAVGYSIASHAYPEELRSRKLYIRVDSAVWLQELTLLKPSLISKLNAALGPDEAIEDLVIRLGRSGGQGSPQSKDHPS